MSGMNDLKTAVGGAVNEMQKAAAFIQSHPAAQEDPAFADLAARLNAAAAALGGVDTDAAAAGAGGATGGGADTTTGAQSGGGQPAAG